MTALLRTILTPITRTCLAALWLVAVLALQWPVAAAAMESSSSGTVHAMAMGHCDHSLPSPSPAKPAPCGLSGCCFGLPLALAPTLPDKAIGETLLPSASAGGWSRTVLPLFEPPRIPA